MAHQNKSGLHSNPLLFWSTTPRRMNPAFLQSKNAMFALSVKTITAIIGANVGSESLQKADAMHLPFVLVDHSTTNEPCIFAKQKCYVCAQCKNDFRNHWRKRGFRVPSKGRCNASAFCFGHLFTIYRLISSHTHAN